MQCMDELEQRAAVVDCARRMSGAGLAPGKSGNVSCRWRDGLLITPSALAYDRMVGEDIVELDLAGVVRAGRRPASSEWPFHTAIYRSRPDALAIVHTHSPHAAALSCARRGLPAFHYMVAMAGGEDIRCAEYATFGTAQLAENILTALAARKAALLANHGAIALSDSLDGALGLAMEVENLASVYLKTLGASLQPVLLDAKEMQRVLGKFEHYGRE